MVKRIFSVFLSMIIMSISVGSTNISAFDEIDKNHKYSEIIWCNNKYLIYKDIKEAEDISNVNKLVKRAMLNPDEDIDRQLVSINSGEYYVNFRICKDTEKFLLINYYLRESMRCIRRFFKGYKAEFPIVVTNHNYYLNCNLADIWNTDYNILDKTYERKYSPLIIDKFPDSFNDKDYLIYLIRKIIYSDFRINALKNDRNNQDFKWFIESLIDLMADPLKLSNEEIYCEINPRLIMNFYEDNAEECIEINRLILENWFAKTIRVDGERITHYDLLLKKESKHSLSALFLFCRGKESVNEIVKYLEKIKTDYKKELVKERTNFVKTHKFNKYHRRKTLMVNYGIDAKINKIDADLKYLKFMK